MLTENNDLHLQPRVVLRRLAPVFHADAIACCTVGAYWFVLILHFRPLIFVIGAALAFYIPGADVVRLFPGMFSRLSLTERLAISVVFSISFLGLSALALDFTPLGITQTTVAAAVTLLTLLTTFCNVIVQRATAGTGQSQPGHHALVVLAVLLVAAVWGLGSNALASMATGVDKIVHPRPAGGYSELMSSCVLQPGGYVTLVTVHASDHGDTYSSYGLRAQADREMVLNRHLPDQMGRQKSISYQLQVKGTWSRLTVSLLRRSPSRAEGPPLVNTLSLQDCTKVPDSRPAHPRGML